MRIPIEWLKEYVDIKVGEKQLAEALMMSGTEIESLDYSGFSFKNIVVGEILEIKKHPSSGKLQIAKVKVSKDKILEIICGAPNIEEGQKVPTALPGAKLGEVEIKKTEIRGIESEGMLCSEAELGISDDHTGIMILDPRAEMGRDLREVLGKRNMVMEAEITPNRPDLLSMIGISKEAASLFNLKLNLPKITFKEIDEQTSEVVKVKIEDEKLCPRYIARTCKISKIEPSPRWLQDRLSTCGIRPINAVVDITNYVLLEYGQPLHAFDGEKLSGSEIMIRRAKRGEEIITLDGIERKLTSDNLVIADKKKPVAIAGVMGGKNSEVSSRTRLVILESANFNKVSVRKTAKSLGITTEASMRFEKGLPLSLAEVAIGRACQLLQEICGAEIFKGKVDLGTKKLPLRFVALHPEKVEKFLGIKIPEGQMIKILESLGIILKNKAKDKLTFQVPDWRADISIEEDLFEELARIYGYDKMPQTLPEGPLPEVKELKADQKLQEVKNILVGAGFSEVYSYSFLSEENLKKAGTNPKDCLKVSNPISEDQEFMRPSLIPSLLLVVAKNQKRFSNIKIFELASIYQKSNKELPDQLKRLTGLVFGEEFGPKYFSKDELSYYYAKGAVELIFKKIMGQEIEVLEDGKLVISGKIIGQLGEIDPKILNNFDIKKRVAYFDLDFETLVDTYKKIKMTFQKIPSFPQVLLDLAIIVDEGLTYLEVGSLILQTGKPFVKRVELFDLFAGPPIPSGKKNMAFHITYGADRTLTEKEIKKVHEKIAKTLADNLGAEIRK